MPPPSSAPEPPAARRDLELVLAAVALLGVVAFVAGVLLDLRPLRLAAKPLPVLALAALAAAQRTSLGRMLAVGLAFGAAGDLLLEASPRLFLAGLGAFLAGHIVYVVAFARDERRLRPARALPPFAFGVAMLAILWPGLGALRVPVTAYMLVICAMGWRAAARIEPGRPGAWLATAGAILFLASDTALGIRKFLAPFPADRAVIMATYWGAQLLIALSVRRPRRDTP